MEVIPMGVLFVRQSARLQGGYYMKKLLCFMLAVVLLLPTIITVQASAVDTSSSNYDELIALAKKTFPEHADKIENNNVYRSSNQRSTITELRIAEKDTRPVDDNAIMTYTEYNNGIITLAMARFSPSANIIEEDSVSHSTYEQFTARIVASVVEGPQFTATGVQYRIYPSSYDRIISVGNYSIRGYTNDDFDIYLRSNETASLFACIGYAFPCPVGQSSYSGEVIFKLSNNVATVDFEIW